MIDRFRIFAAGMAVIAASTIHAHAADLANGTPTPIKAPECIDDPAAYFFSETVPPPGPVHPTNPIGHYYEVVRYIRTSAVSTPTSYDYGHFPQAYPWPPLRGQPLTGFTVPEPKYRYQRTSRTDADADNASGFQLHCTEAGSFINTFTFPHVEGVGGGPHSIYGYSFDADKLPSIFDSNPATDFVMQVFMEIPWFYSVADPAAPAGVVPVGQASMFAYLRDRHSGKAFGIVLGIFDNRATATVATYTPVVAHDTQTPFVSTPVGAGSKYATLSPYSSTFTGTTWSGLRFFRMHITQDNFRSMLADVNAFCAANTALNYCAGTAPGAPAFSNSISDYQLTDFGVLHEVFPQSDDANLSMGMHVVELGAWNFR
jgi:hypothetical protein